MWGRRGAGFIARHFFCLKSKKIIKNVLHIKINVYICIVKRQRINVERKNLEL